MANTTIAILMLITIFMVGILLGFEMPGSMFLAAVATCAYLKIPFSVIVGKGCEMIMSTSLIAVPMFICAGVILGKTSISDQLIDFADAIVGWMRGGLAMANVVASIFFGGISGSPVADIYSLGTVLIPKMEKRGYDREFSTAVTTASALEGLLIPPSHNILIYCTAALTVLPSINIGKCLLSGIVPGLVMGLMMCAYCYWVSVKKNYPKGDAFSMKKVLKIGSQSMWGLMTIVIIVVGLFTGICTTNEAAALSIFWALFVSKFIYKDLTLKKFWSMMGDCIVMVCRMGFSYACAGTFSFLVSYLKIPMTLSNMVAQAHIPVWMTFLLINLVLLFLGCFVGMANLLLITTPIFLPLCVSLGMDPIQYGAMCVLNLGIGLMTPPVGAALNAAYVVSGIPIEKISVSLLPWWGIMFATLMLVTYVPAISMFLPNMMM